MKYPMIAAAVVTALAGANAAHALDVTNTLAAPFQLVAAGSSAVRDSFLAALNGSVCASGTLTAYRAAPTALQDFRAYSCTITANGTVAGFFGGAAGQNMTVYYRSEGGSAWGPASIATNTAIQSLVVDSRCTLNGTISTPTGAVPASDCSVVGYQIATDTATSGLTLRTTQLGVSDEEPAMYVDSNYPGVASTRFPAQSGAVHTALTNLAHSTGFGQVFGVLLSNSGATAGITSLTPAEVAGLYSGGITDWSATVDPASGLPNTAGTVTVVRRENGSGTQVAAAQQFLQTANCSSLGSLAFVSDADPIGGACSAGNPTGGANTDNVIARGTTSDLEACVQFNPGAVGLNVFKSTAPAGTHYAKINGVAPSKVNAATGLYNFWYELTLAKVPGLTGNANTVASGIISVTQRAAFAPNTDSVMALPNLFNIPAHPVSGTGVPISLFTRHGNSCQTPTQP